MVGLSSSYGHTSHSGQKLQEEVDSLLGDQVVHPSFYTQYEDGTAVTHRPSHLGAQRPSHLGAFNQVNFLRNPGTMSFGGNSLFLSRHFSSRLLASPTRSLSTDTAHDEDSIGTSVLSPGNEQGRGSSPPGRKAPASPSSPTLPSPAQQHAVRVRVERARIGARREGTKKLYGDVTNPAKSGAYIGEFYRWCKAGPGVVVNGLKTSNNKKVYHVIPSTPIATEFFQDHFLKRPKSDKKGNFVVENNHSDSAISNCIKALVALYVYQSQVYEGGPTAFAAKYGDRPNLRGELKALRGDYRKGTATERRVKHLPRGAAALTMQGYTREQNQQLFEFGIVNNSAANNTSLSASKIRTVHTHHTFAHNCALRFDDRQKLLLSQFCCMDAPGKLGDRCGKLLCAVLDWRKTNIDGAFETVYSLRHYDNPVRCCWFAFGLELYSQIHLDGCGLEVQDFVPQTVGLDKAGNPVKRFPWYDRFFLYGNTQSKKGRASVPSPSHSCNYENCRSAFHVVYDAVEPAIRAHHVLHLQRGAVARMADMDNLESHEIASAGGWYRNGSLFKHYLTGVPMRFIRWVCGFPDLKDDESDQTPLVKRGQLDPPKELWENVYPFYQALKKDLAENEEAYEVEPKDTTVHGFLDLMETSAKYFLQDCAVMYEKMSDHPIFSTPLLMSPEFHDYRESLLASIAKLTAEEENKTCHSNSNSQIMEFLQKIYRKLTLSDGFEKATDCLTDSTHGSSFLGHSLGSSDSAIPSTVTAGPDHFGSVPPVPPVTPSPMAAAQQASTFPAAVATDPTTWPKDHTPNWAKNKAICNGLPSPAKLIQEYTQGFPVAPALKHLEEHYGPDKRPRDSWRKGNTKNKAWCLRLPVYGMVEQLGAVAAEAKLVSIIQENYMDQIEPPGTTSEPGATIMNKLLLLLRQQKAGAQQRSEKAKQTHKRRKLAKAAEEDARLAAEMQLDGAIQQV